MSFSYDRYDRRASSNRRTTLGYWIPLVVTVTIATAGLAAWIWSERQSDGDDSDDEGEDSDSRHDAESKRYNEPPAYGASETASLSQDMERQQEEEGLVARMSGAIRRTPSPQQVFDSASRKVVAGVAAAGAVVGGALSSIREEDKDAFGDHSRWSEEAELRRNVEAQSADSSAAVARHVEAFSAVTRQEGAVPRQRGTTGRRKTVAVVVSAESGLEGLHEEERGVYDTEQISILSHLPQIDPASTELFVLIYAPSLNSDLTSTSHRQTASPLGSSYSTFSTPAQTPGEELASIDPQPHTPALSARDTEQQDTYYSQVHAEASRLVERRTMAMPFATPTGHVHMLKHLAPDLVYIAESLAGKQGECVEQIRGWVGQVVVVVGDGESGLSGLVDTEDEAERRGSMGDEGRSKWWEDSTVVGLGLGVEVVDEVRVGDDFERRTSGRN